MRICTPQGGYTMHFCAAGRTVLHFAAGLRVPRLSLPSQSTAARHSVRHSTDTSQATPAAPTLLHHTLPDLHGAHNIAHLETVAVHAVSSSLLSRHSAVRQALVVFVCDHLSCKHHGSASHSAAPSLVAAPALLYLPHPGMHGMSSASHHYAVAGHVPFHHSCH